MTNVNRRSFLWKTSAGAAVVGVLAVAPSVAAPRPLPEVPVPNVAASTFSEPLVAYVRDVAAGEVVLQVGTREVIVHDANLVARLIKAVG